MDVTTDNFDEAIELIRKSARECTFAAFDCEFTGLDTAPWRGVQRLDTVQSRYSNTKDSAESFALLQMGWSFFRWEQEEGRFVAATYNVNMFPRVESRFGSSGFRCQASSLQFLGENGFDFNKCVRRGMPTLSLDAYKRKLEKLEEPAKDWTRSSKVNLTRPNDRATMQATRKKVEAWIASRAAAQVEEEEDGEQEEKAAGAAGESPPFLVLDPMNTMLRRATYEVVESEFPTLRASKEEADNVGRRPSLAALRVTDFGTEAGRQAADEAAAEAAKEEKRREVDRRCGAAHVLQAVIDARVPVVGHNCLSDLCHILHKLDRPLPQGAREFGARLLELFPCLIDTKHLLSNVPALQVRSASSSLGDAFDAICRTARTKPCIVQDPELGDMTTVEHEAGYDAFMTGSVLVAAAMAWKGDASALVQLCADAHEGLLVPTAAAAAAMAPAENGAAAAAAVEEEEEPTPGAGSDEQFAELPGDPQELREMVNTLHMMRTGQAMDLQALARGQEAHHGPVALYRGEPPSDVRQDRVMLFTGLPNPSVRDMIGILSQYKRRREDRIMLQRVGNGDTRLAFVMMPSEKEAKAVMEAVAAGELAKRGEEWQEVRVISHKDYEKVAAVPSDDGTTFDAALSLAGVDTAATAASGAAGTAQPSRKRPRPAAAAEERREMEEEENTVLHRAGRSVWRHLVSPLMTMTFGKPPVMEGAGEAERVQT